MLFRKLDENGWQPIHESVRGGRIEVVKYLVDMGADLTAKTSNGATPLWWARRILPPDSEIIPYLESVSAPDEGPEEEEVGEEEEEEKEEEKEPNEEKKSEEEKKEGDKEQETKEKLEDTIKESEKEAEKEKDEKKEEEKE